MLQPACPAGVQYGTLIEETREAILSVNKQALKEKLVRKGAFDHLFADQRKMKKAVKSLVERFIKIPGLQKVARKIGFLELFPPFMKDMERVLPSPPKRKRTVVEKSAVKVKVAFFTGCLMDTLFQDTNRNTIDILPKLGCEIIIPKMQQCCGALHGHSGEMDKAKRNAQANLEAFEINQIDFIVNNAGGCRFVFIRI